MSFHRSLARCYKTTPMAVCLRMLTRTCSNGPLGRCMAVRTVTQCKGSRNLCSSSPKLAQSRYVIRVNCTPFILVDELFTEQSVSGISTLFLMLAMHPHIQEKAQAELDSVLGGVRLPIFDDRPHLPYLDALIKEALRFQPPTPLGECPLFPRILSCC